MPAKRVMRPGRALALLLALTAVPAWGQSFPQRPVRVIVPFPAGAAADQAARVLSRKLTEYWGHAVVVDNRAGVPAIMACVQAPADGHTLLLAAGSQMVTWPLMRRLPYDPQRDFVPVARLVTTPPVLTSHPALGVKSVRELVHHLHQHPGVLNFSSSGVGSPNQLAMEMFMMATQTHVVHVPYKGGAPSVVDLVNGQVQVGINAIPSVLAYVQAGRLTPLAVASRQRAKMLPQVPTLAESGVDGFDYTIWYGLFAPAQTPSALVARIEADVVRALRDPAVVHALTTQGHEPAAAGAQELAEFLTKDRAHWARLVKERRLAVQE